MVKISVVGSGKVGSTTAFVLALKDLGDITLIDVVENVPQGEALDMMHSAYSAFGSRIEGSNNFNDLSGSDIVINTAGMARKPGMDRLDLLNKNKEIVTSVAGEIKKHAPNSIVIQVSNPIDVMNYVMHKETGFDHSKVIGMGSMLDAQRFALFLSEELNVRPIDVKTMLIGEHGESMVPLFSQSYYEDKKIDDMLNDEQRQNIIENTRKAGADVIGLKGATVFAPSVAVWKMVDNIINDKAELLPVSCYLQGEYGVEDVCMGVPAKLRRKGLQEIVELEISEDEKKAFHASAEKLKGIISEIGV